MPSIDEFLMLRLPPALVSLALIPSLLLAPPQGQATAADAPPAKPTPTHADVHYGPHERNVLDFWKAPSSTPTPLVVYIHGGGFRAGDKGSIKADTLQQLLEAGISVAAIHYRFVAEAPLPAAHHDAQRALQFLRWKADEWNVDGDRVGAYGGSAGAQLCMWLAFHDDLRDPQSDDPVARQSTRLTVVAARAGQTTMDFKWWGRNIPGYNRPHRPSTDYFGSVPEDTVRAVVRDISPLSLIGVGDPPIFLWYAMAPQDPPPEDPNEARGWKIHHVAFGTTLKARMDELGIEADLSYPGVESPYGSMEGFFIAKLKEDRA